MLLTAIWLLPVLGAVVVDLLPRPLARPAGIVVALATLALAVVLAVLFQNGHQGYQFQVNVTWISQYHIDYHLGIDGVSLLMTLLNSFLTVIAMLAIGPKLPRKRGFVALILLQEGAMAGVFMSADLVLFYVFWEAMLIPAYFLIWQWGEGDRPGWASLRFVIYTLSGSLLMLVGIIGEYVFAGGGTHTFELAQLAAHPPSRNLQFGLFFLFAVAFAIKVPLFPLHSWLPKAYGAAPIPYLVTLAGVMGKAGAYAMLRILVPLFPHPILWWNWDWVMVVLGAIAIIWGALMALNQRDLKQVVAYSSVSHMGFIVLGIFSLTQQGQQGAVLQMVNHGLIIPALFLLVGWVGARTGTRDRSILKDLAPRMPWMAGVFLIVTLASLGLPGLNSFVGEFMTLLGAWQLAPWLAVVAALGLILAPVYMLRLFQGVMYS
ncbi:MAG TPA: NADH-quinone oxidoreductase subunit M, partial [Candidatus Dormibacteraeota bacterium]|nr:NADH-quinone oxidoreductase subunit M [Candidatus Dormibacteraeota bacterium]